MRKYLLDTGIASDCANGRLGVEERVREAIRRGARIGISTPVLGELFAGIEHSNAPDRHRRVLWRSINRWTLWPFDAIAAEEYGRLYAQLRRSGRIIQQVDLQSAAIAITLGDCTVVTKDSDFDAIAGLDVEDWSKP